MGQQHQSRPSPPGRATPSAGGGVGRPVGAPDRRGLPGAGRRRRSIVLTAPARLVMLGRRGNVRAGQALTETALLISLFLMPVYGVLVAHRLVDAHLQVATVAREAARVMAEAPSAEAALAAGTDRTAAVLAGLTLRSERLTVRLDPGPFTRTSLVSADVRYRVDLRGLPLFGLPDPVISHEIRQPVQVHASR